MTGDQTGPHRSAGDELRDLLDSLDVLDEVEGRARETASAADAAVEAAVSEDRSIIRARARLASGDSAALGDVVADLRRRIEESRRRVRRSLADSRERRTDRVAGHESTRAAPAASDRPGVDEPAAAATGPDGAGRDRRDREVRDRLATTLDQAARRLLPERRGRDSAGSVEDTLALIVAGAIDAVPHVAHAGISMIDRENVIQSRAPSDSVAADLDVLQNTLGEGPCLDAVYDRRPVWADDLLDAHPRWPRFAAAARDLGVTGVLSFQLFTAADGTVGALNLYAGAAGTFDEASIEIGSLFASQAALALHGARRASDLTAALATRDVIGQAKGILMERFGVDAVRAFRLLVDASQTTNIKLHDVAEWTVQETLRKHGDDDADRVEPTL